MIVTQGLTKVYGGTAVVDNVSLSLPKSGVTSIVGPNGAGKSTFLSLISRLLPPTSGAVRVDDLDLATSPSDALARKLSILRQDNHVASRLTVRELVGFGRYPYSRGRLSAGDREIIENSIGYLDLGDLSERFVDELSGGQRQRAFIGMVLCQDTDYVLLDEPLNNLDMKHSVSLMKLIRRIADERGKAFVLVLHDINFASIYSDHIVAMRDGTVVHQGRPQDILRGEVLRDIFGIDIAVHEVDGRRVGFYYV
jgi:iron complex transport system ATP-binding protein